MDGVVALLLHKYEVPLVVAVIVAVLPLQILVSPLIVTVGVGFTITVSVAIPEQPLVVAVTVYPVTVEGLTIMLAAVEFPGFQK